MESRRKRLTHYEGMSEALAEKDENEVVDEGHIPGDGLGAGGIDSKYWSYVLHLLVWISSYLYISLAHCWEVTFGHL